ncbi:MAG: ornithine carbamoyltransferase [Hadesarchaea archaeon]|nr:ornithine carbamoyltransferase [Hadesarchaea archaeon]
MTDLYGRDLITTQEWSKEEISETLELAKEIKKDYYDGNLDPILDKKTFFMLFYNSSTRTRASFESAMTALGGHSQFVDVSTTRIAGGEDPKDVARVYDRYGHGLGIRILESAVDYVYGRGNDYIRKYADNCDIPVINMADDKFHPCQGMADLLTVQENFPDYEGKNYTITWAYSDKIRSWCSIQEEALLMSRYGMNVTLAHPEGFELDSDVMDTCRKNAKESGAEFEISNNYEESLEDADIIFPRSWASHGCMMNGINQFGEDKECRLRDKHKDWILDQERLNLTSSDSIVTHVLPVYRGKEATDEVMDGPHSVIYDQAENRLHAQMAILAQTMKK